jgi:membrane fusion protein (multidrug efflux system)
LRARSAAAPDPLARELDMTAISAAPHSSDTPAAEPPQRALLRFLPWVILAVVLVGVVLVATRWDRFTADARIQATDNASIQADAVVLDAKVAGYVQQVNFRDFQSVHKGDVLVVLDDRDYRAAVARAQAGLAKAKASLANLANEQAAQRATIEVAQANATTVASKLQLAEQDNRRFVALVNTGAVTGQEADSARANVDSVRATQQGNLASVELQRRQLDVLGGQGAQRQADVLAAQAALDTALIDLSYTRIVAPADGTVNQRTIQPGALLTPGAAVANFIPRAAPYILANYKETQLARVHPGQPVTIRVDGLPGRVIAGRVSRLSPASGATFTTVPADNATGNFTKVTQRIPLRIDFAPGQPAVALLRAGMSVTTRIDTGSDR